LPTDSLSRPKNGKNSTKIGQKQQKSTFADKNSQTSPLTIFHHLGPIFFCSLKSHQIDSNYHKRRKKVGFFFDVKLLTNRTTTCSVHIMLRDELTLKCVNIKIVFGFGYPRACRFRKTKQTNQIWFLVRLIFFKT
jgi:hypothetical protein